MLHPELRFARLEPGVLPGQLRPDIDERGGDDQRRERAAPHRPRHVCEQRDGAEGHPDRQTDVGDRRESAQRAEAAKDGRAPEEELAEEAVAAERAEKADHDPDHRRPRVE